jgi:hypothetical protein
MQDKIRLAAPTAVSYGYSVGDGEFGVETVHDTVHS